MSKKQVKSDAEKYSKMTQREHILKRPDTYVGDIELTNEMMWVKEDEKESFIKKTIKYSPGFFKIFDEILVNAADHKQNDPTLSTIKVEYNMEEGYISVYNDGDNGIPIEIHKEHNMYVPSMIFGELLTSSNYDDTQERTTGGKNGLGSKLTGLFSKKFIVEVDDGKRKLKFKQTWTDNMEHKTEPIITSAKTKSGVKITFYPDMPRFKLEGLDQYHKELFHRRTFDIAGTIGSKINVYFNEKKLGINNFKDYINMYYPESSGNLYMDSIDRWSVGAIYKPDSNRETISFVNNINTYHGGTHCDYVIENISKVLIDDYIKKKAKEIKITANQIKENMVFFINSIIVNPNFGSQTKDALTTKSNKFGSKYVPTDTFLKKLAKCGIVEQVIQLAEFKENISLKKTDGKKKTTITGIPKLEDANKAGGKDSHECTLILTEGDSAKTTAMSGRSVVGNDYYGVFPLKGKVLNVREVSSSKLLANEEISCLKTIIGLKQGMDYSTEEAFKTLRYGKIMVLTDQDLDGSHIKGLLLNLFHTLWPSLLKRQGFIQYLNTPIVKATKGKETIIFYNLMDYEKWKEKAVNYTIKYYKGLGTSNRTESIEYFTDIDNSLVHFICNSNAVAVEYESEEEKTEENISDAEEKASLFLEPKDDDDAIKLAFEKARANDRKKWLMSYDKKAQLKIEDKVVSLKDFVHKELVHFSDASLMRAIPSVIDGFKPSQRKALFGAFLRGLEKEEIKVAQLAGFVSDKAAYHHGEASLTGTIINMAQDYVGSNNINVLFPSGQFGTRMQGGNDSASPRYIFTRLEGLTSIIFNQYDNNVLINQEEDGKKIEPETYVPIIPMILVNGANGIGTGFSTTIPQYNPLDCIKNIRNLLKGKDIEEMTPWYQGFKGTIKKVDDYNYECHGCWTIKGNKLIITELPIGTWTEDYKIFLDKMLAGEPVKKKTEKKNITPLKSFINNGNDIDVNFELTFEDGYLDTEKSLEKKFKLVANIKLTNMHVYSPDGVIKKYKSVETMLYDYYIVRLQLYSDRKDFMLGQLARQLELLSWKVKFILMVIEDKIIIRKQKKAVLEEKLNELGFPILGEKNYDYLLGMELWNLTFEKVEELKKKHKEKQSEYDTLKGLSPEDIWLGELQELEVAYNKWLLLKDNLKKEQIELIKKKVVKKSKKN